MYQLIVPKSVQKQIDALPDSVRERVDVAIRALSDDPRPEGVVKLRGSNSEYRIRVGNYRIIYEIIDLELVVLLIQCKHRREVYRKR